MHTADCYPHYAICRPWLPWKPSLWKRWHNAGIVIATILGLLSGSELQAVDVSGTIESNTTWTSAESPYKVTGHLSVAEGVTLTIQPGVRVQFTQYRGLFVNGALQAVGTAALPITFTGTTETKGWWQGIQVTGTGSANLDWCHIAYAGYWENVGLLKNGSGALSLKNSTVRGHVGDGLRLAAGYSSWASLNNTFENNTRGVRLDINASFDDPTSTFAGNEVDVHIDGGTLTRAVTWNLRPAHALFASGYVTVATNALLTIKPGTVVKFAQYSGVVVKGHLEAPGTPDLGIYFTDWRDDAVGGDANHDGANTKPAAGWWRSLEIQGTGSANLAHCTFRYAGYWSSIGIHQTSSGNLNLRYCTVSQTSGHGLQVENSSGTNLLEQSTFTDNTLSGLYLNAGRVTATGCAFASNGNYGILQEVNESVDYARNQFVGNTWGSVGVNGGTLVRPVTWSRGGGDLFSVVVRGDVTVSPEAGLTIQPGVRVQFTQYRGLFVNGALQAVGTAALPITFTGTTETKGWWQGIQVNGTGSAHLDWCQVACAGYWDSVGLLKKGAGTLSLRNSNVRDHGGDGLRIDGSTGQHHIENTAFSANINGMVAQNLASPLTLTSCRFGSNTTYGVRNYGPAEIDARLNWWGHDSGPYHAVRNTNGLGNRVSDLVLFEPWKDSQPAGVLVVTLAPDAACEAGGRWSVDGATWNLSGTPVSLKAGVYTLQCNSIQDWGSPAPQTVTISGSETTSLTITYVRQSSTTVTFSPGPRMNSARMGHTLATLADGRVVLFGGHGTGFKALNTAEIWSPGTETFTVLTMNHTHDDPVFAALEDGRLLLAGGSADLGIPQYAAAELFDPATGAFGPVGDMVRFRSGAGAAALNNGQVLIAGAWWTHNDAHTFGEVYNPSTGAFVATGALNTRRAHPVALPTSDGKAVVFGGSDANGGPPVLSVELFDPASRGFSMLQTELFPDDPGWGLRGEQRPITTQRLSDGRYLLLASRTREGTVRHLLFTFDPQTKTFAPFAVTPELPAGSQYSLWAPVVDNQRGRAHLLAQVTGSHPADLCLFTVDLATGALTKSESTGNLRPAYYLYGAGVILLQDGRLFISGGSEDGSNFKPVQETLLVTPGTSSTAQPKLSITAEDENAVSLTWNPASGPVTVETSTNLADWTVLSGADVSQGTIRVPLSTTGSCCYFRLRQTTP